MKKKTLRLCFTVLYCLLAAVAFTMDFQLHTGSLSTRPFVFYTSLSNLLCSGFMLISLIHSICKSKTQSPFAPLCKYLFTAAILLTALVHNLFLEYHSSLYSYFADIKNALHHLILPLLFLLDWLLFYPKGKIKIYQPFLVPVIPLFYVSYILIRAAYVQQAGISVNVLYPYFFLNIENLGWQGFGIWMGILLCAILALGYGLYGIDYALDRRAARRT